ncbi:MAG: Gfo/Idh/MocA family oxidoreductase [Candidatus Vecturithrix sp.]|nr:Gfo/Idh/MocA family oxidoreductase [Candidatus Vecturithrix sp.]
MGKIQVGFIGCGRISDLHALGYRDHPDAEIAAVSDKDGRIAAKKGNEWGARKIYADYREMLDDPDIDAVEILTPQKLHEPMVIEAAASGKHILVQKPMTIDLESADRMIQAAKAGGKIYKVIENYMYYPPIRFAKQVLEAGEIGTPINMRIKFISGSSGGWDVPAETWAWRMEENVAGRGMQTFDHGHHMWAIAWFFMGEIERVCAWIDSYDNIIDCPSTIMWKYKNGIQYGLCDYTHAYEMYVPSDYYANDEWFEINGSKGIILVHRCTGKINPGPSVSVFKGQKWEHYDHLDSDWAAGFVGATHNFIAAMKGEEVPQLSGEQARKILAVALAIQKSSQERREVYVDELDSPDGAEYSRKKIAEDIVRRKQRKLVTLDDLKNNPRLL